MLLLRTCSSKLLITSSLLSRAVSIFRGGLRLVDTSARTLTFDMLYPHTGGSTTGRTYRLAEFTYSRLSLSPKPRLPRLAHPPRMISGVFSSHSHLAFYGTQVLFDRLSSWASDVSPVDSDSSTFAAVALLHGFVFTHSSGPTSITLQRGVHSFYTVRDGLHMELSSSSLPHSFVFSSLFSISR